MSIDWKGVLGKVAPTLAGALGGPLAAAAVSAIGTAVLGKPDATPSEVATAVGEMGPDVIVQLKQAERAFVVRMRELGIAEDALFAKDTQDARAHSSDNQRVFYLGVVILAIFAFVNVAALIGAYLLATKAVEINPGMVAAVFTFIGSTVGYIAAIAQQVVAFYFGSSKSSQNKDATLDSALSKMMK